VREDVADLLGDPRRGLEVAGRDRDYEVERRDGGRLRAVGVPGLAEHAARRRKLHQEGVGVVLPILHPVEDRRVEIFADPPCPLGLGSGRDQPLRLDDRLPVLIHRRLAVRAEFWNGLNLATERIGSRDWFPVVLPDDLDQHRLVALDHGGIHAGVELHRRNRQQRPAHVGGIGPREGLGVVLLLLRASVQSLDSGVFPVLPVNQVALVAGDCTFRRSRLAWRRNRLPLKCPRSSQPCA
jgi:hypothetical protein